MTRRKYNDQILKQVTDHSRLPITNDIHEKAERVNCISTIEQKPAIEKYNQLYKETIERKMAAARPKPKGLGILKTIYGTTISLLSII